MGGPLVAQDDPQLAAWSSGAILARAEEVPGSILGAALSQPRDANALRSCAKRGKSCAETRIGTGELQIFSTTLSQLSYRGCCEGQGALAALDQAKRRMLCRCLANGCPSSSAWEN
jgi:hypothetical protein